MINHSQLPRETHQKVYLQTLEAGGDWDPPNPSQLSTFRHQICMAGFPGDLWDGMYYDGFCLLPTIQFMLSFENKKNEILPKTQQKNAKRLVFYNFRPRCILAEFSFLTCLVSVFTKLINVTPIWVSQTYIFSTRCTKPSMAELFSM